MKEESMRIIDELPTAQGKVEQPTYGEEDKLTTLTMQGGEEIVEIEETILK
jgi:hypothetical protein